MNNHDNISPKLASLKRDLPFRTPRGYFDDFPARMQHRLEIEKQSATKSKTRIIDLIKPALGLAAGFAAVFFLVYWPVKVLNQNQISENPRSVTELFLPDELINLFERMDEQTFYALLEDEPEVYTMETETLAAYLAASYSDYDVFIETQNGN